MLPILKLNKTKLNIFPIFDFELYEGGGGMEDGGMGVIMENLTKC